LSNWESSGADGTDSDVLGEINVGSVCPIPDEAPAEIRRPRCRSAAVEALDSPRKSASHGSVIASEAIQGYRAAALDRFVAALLAMTAVSLICDCGYYSVFRSN
jgi:hypothetical protein